MILKNKLLAIFVTLAFAFNISYADNKTDLLSQITQLESNLNLLKTNSTKDLETKVLALSKNFDDTFASLWYDTKTVNYLVGLWKLTTNFKEDLTLELNALNKEISEKTLSELNDLSSVKNNISVKYTTVTDSEKTTLWNSIIAIENNYKNLSDSFSGKINILNNKYSTNLTEYKNTLKNAYNSNTGTINWLNNFSSKYESLFTLNTVFEKNYSVFKDTYLSFAWELTLFSETKQKYYVDALKKEFEKIRDLNIQANKSLENYQLDIDRLSDILLENFQNSLKLKMNDSYWVIYSDSDINSIVSRFNTAKNRYYDVDGKLKVNEVVSNSWSLEEINFLTEKLSLINTKITDLIWTGSNNNSFDNVKIRLENEMVKFYNANYNWYREDLLLKLKEKLNIVALESKNTILAADTVDLRYSLLNDKISSSNDINYINTQISEFKKDILKYGYLNSDIINKKIANIDINLSKTSVKKELSQFKFTKMSQTIYDAELLKIFTKLKLKYPQKYITKLNTLVIKINGLLENWKISDKTKFMLLCVKLNILNYVN